MLIFLINSKTTAILLRMAVFSSLISDNILMFGRNNLNFVIFKMESELKL